MSKRKRVPAPFQRILPAVIRTFGPRVILLAGGVAALLVLLTGGSYLLSRASEPSKVPKHTIFKKVTAPAPSDAQVMGTSTTHTTSSASQTMPKQSTTTTAGNETAVRTHASSQTEPSQLAATASQADSQASAGGNQSSDDNEQSQQGTEMDADTPLGTLSLQLPLGL